MAVTQEWNGDRKVLFRPVLQQGPNPENKEFWEATPSGEAVLNFRGPSFDDRKKEYQPGDYYYIDLMPSEDGGWLLATRTEHSGSNGSVELCTRGGKHTAGYNEAGFSYGSLQMGIDNMAAFVCFDKAGAIWDVQFKWAEKSDDDKKYSGTA
jgi:hypothetical protein